jgi:hypothetical protein
MALMAVESFSPAVVAPAPAELDRPPGIDRIVDTLANNPLRSLLLAVQAEAGEPWSG